MHRWPASTQKDVLLCIRTRLQQDAGGLLLHTHGSKKTEGLVRMWGGWSLWTLLDVKCCSPVKQFHGSRPVKRLVRLGGSTADRRDQ